MKKTIKNIVFVGTISLTLFGCQKYLDVVPDNTLKLENIFSLKEEAWNALAKVYSYMPNDENLATTYYNLGDEWMGRIDQDNNLAYLRGLRIMRGLQSASAPQLGIWSGTEGAKPMYVGIRQADVLINNIDGVRDMSDAEKRNWKAQAKFLKAYYCFLLVRQYGPIVLPKQMANPNSDESELFLRRSKVEECFNYILTLINESIVDLSDRIGENELGQVDKTIAKAIKARILTYRASPFFNGNNEFYGDFLDHDGQPFFDLTYKEEKWRDALEAINEAVAAAESNGAKLYQYSKEPYLYDKEAFEKNPAKMKTLYDLRMVICDPWNEELIWGYSNINYYGDGGVAQGSNIRLPDGYGEGVKNSNAFSFQWYGSTYGMLEKYYTANGLPINEDLNFNELTKHEVLKTPGVMDYNYQNLYGYLQPGADLINLYLGREPRFYANLGISGGYWRGHGVRINTRMFANTEGGYHSSYFPGDHLSTGIGVQKMVHPESQSGAWQRTIKFPYPIIRLADLYLLRAEAMNELNGPSPAIYADINKIRKRAGIPNVEDVWADASLARTVNKHLNKNGLREIIHHERAVELAFEGIHFWDMWRFKLATEKFSTPVWGWNHLGATAASFFNLSIKQQRRFTVTDYLWPIDINEMNTNGSLIQNPGW